MLHPLCLIQVSARGISALQHTNRDKSDGEVNKYFFLFFSFFFFKGLINTNLQGNIKNIECGIFMMTFKGLGLELTVGAGKVKNVDKKVLAVGNQELSEIQTSRVKITFISCLTKCDSRNLPPGPGGGRY